MTLTAGDRVRAKGPLDTYWKKATVLWAGSLAVCVQFRKGDRRVYHPRFVRTDGTSDQPVLPALL